jgi:2-keto-4-pentenoate hydratase/2-oxohepta-3-ene-1,7-dioic acid hydratase in catechol pathway
LRRFRVHVATSFAWVRTIATAREFSQSGFDASAQSADEIPDVPIIFTKTPETVIATDTDILYPEGISSTIDYEAELAVVIGKSATSSGSSANPSTASVPWDRGW